MKFLIVDDSPTMRRFVAIALTTAGYTDYEEAEDGQEALKKLQKGGFEFILTDWNMPVMNGLEFVKAVRSDPKLKRMPILMVTTRGNKSDIIDALKARVNNYVVKPFTPDTLKEKIKSVLKSVLEDSL